MWALLLGFDELRARLATILKSFTVADSLKGAITNIRLTPEMAHKPLPQRTLEEIEHAFPVFHASYVADLLSKAGEHLKPCLDRNYERAMTNAKSELDDVEVSLAQVLLGDFDAAPAFSKRFPGRAHDMCLVLAIELYRRGRVEEAERTVCTLLDEDSNWTPTMLALGLSGRVPWPNYPFPDY